MTPRAIGQPLQAAVIGPGDLFKGAQEERGENRGSARPGRRRRSPIVRGRGRRRSHRAPRRQSGPPRRDRLPHASPTSLVSTSRYKDNSVPDVLVAPNNQRASLLNLTSRIQEGVQVQSRMRPDLSGAKGPGRQLLSARCAVGFAARAAEPVEHH
ncbi:hypothetical protein Krad_2514 [Kineococcus radiotolerans SRS30216 = ATCC BAA-149]|uniref:Uncharacterized protein n=1 Tax=Kineococcus radiotolerans (strain ATCC BAA-149 / DSM 14245 / SRS30216) TaxID=266940 RepID=A6WB00_KINRD|nr:hypothetical protein Krad_2514 [Kineococcus radiotolerans SRS30216 = ATCC BAA-149]